MTHQRLNNVLEIFLLAMAVVQMFTGDDFAVLVFILMAHYISTRPFERWLGEH